MEWFSYWFPYLVLWSPCLLPVAGILLLCFAAVVMQVLRDRGQRKK